MNYRKFLQQVIGTIWITAFISGCGTPTVTPATAPTLPPQSNTPLPLPTQAQPTQGDLFSLIQTVQVTPDDNFSDGSLGYIHYIPATDRFVVMLGTHLDNPVPLTYSSDHCIGKAIAFKEYTADMQPTGKYGYISCAAADATSQIIGNDIYLASMTAGPGTQDGKPEWIGWRVEKFDAITWNRLAYVDIPLNVPIEMDDGPTISYINGQVTVSGEYFPDGTPDGPLGRGSHHHFFTGDLQPLGKKILVAPEYPSHCPEVSMIQEPAGDILMFASTTYRGDMIVLRFDKDWNFKERRDLRDNAFFPTGSVNDSNIFYIAYTDTSRNDPKPYRNVGFAAYDNNWNTLQDVAVTEIVNTPDTWIDGESPWVQMHGNRLYVSYLLSRLDPVTGMYIDSQAYVNVYEMIRKP